MSKCILCEREKELTKHHLIPKKLHKRFRKKKVDIDLNQTINLCIDCHNHIHRLYDEKTIAYELYTLELIQEDINMVKFINWIKPK